MNPIPSCFTYRWTKEGYIVFFLFSVARKEVCGALALANHDQVLQKTVDFFEALLSRFDRRHNIDLCVE